MADNKYKMTISRLTVDKLGVKLYDRVSAVIAELVANGYDADAETVAIKAPWGHISPPWRKDKSRTPATKLSCRTMGPECPPT